MKKTLGLAVILGLGTVLLAGCNKTNTPVENPSEENVGIANPASVYCEDQGGTLVLEEGSGICMFEDGSYCEEWAYFRSECQPGEIFYNTIEEQPEIGMANPASVYCEENGGTLQIEAAEDGSQYGICMFEDGSYCEEWAYFRNECQPGEIFYNTIEEQPEIGMANPASVYCEDQGGTLVLEEGSGICTFEDGSYCEEWAYFRNECQPGEIFYDTVTDEIIPEETTFTPEIYSEEDLAAAEDVILNTVNNEWNVMVESFDLSYAGDEISADNLPYCQSLNPDVVECAVFTSNFYIPEQDVEMAGAFEPNSNINGYGWYVGKTTAGEWWVLTNGFG